jgi:hypothetical protein
MKAQKTVETCREYEAEKRKRLSFQSNWLNKFTWLEHKTDKIENFEYFDPKSCILSYIFADLDQFNF